MKLTLVVTEGSSGFFIGKIKEIPAVLTQGKTLEEVKENILDALEMYLQDMREETTTDTQSRVVLEEELKVA